MNFRLSVVGLTLLTLGGLQTAFGAEQVDFVALPVIANAPTFGTYPMLVKIHNTGSDCTGVLTFGGDDQRIEMPIAVAAGKTSSYLAYCGVESRKIGSGTANSDYENYIDFSLKTRSRSGDSGTSQKVTLGQGTRGELLISTDRKGLDYLTDKIDGTTSISGTGKNKRAVTKKIDGEIVSYLRPSISLGRISPFMFYKAIFLGAGSQTISKEEVNALQEYVVQGGTVAIGTNRNSALVDPRWEKLMAQPGSERSVGMGRVLNFDFDPEAPISRIATHKKILSLLQRKIRIETQSTDLQEDEKSFSTRPGAGTGADPFKVHLPTFTQIATVLGAYFFFVIPINYFVLKKINRPEWMWITAPLLAVAFAMVMFKSAGGLYQSPASVMANGNLTCDSDVSNCFYRGSFEIFSPTAGSYDLHLANTTGMDVAWDGRRGPMVQETKLPILSDDGTSLNIPNYHASNLQFREFEIQSTPPNPQPIRFDFSKGEDGVWLLRATNTSGRKLTEVTLVAGEFYSGDRVMQPGETIAVALDKVKPLNFRKYTNDIAQSVDEGNGVHQMLFNTRAGTREGLQAQGRVGLLATEIDYPVGPQLTGPHGYRSKIRLLCLAPKSLKMP